MNAKQDRQGDAPAVGDELHRRRKNGSSQGDLQAIGLRERWKRIGWPHLGHRIWSCQDAGWGGADWSICSVGGSGCGNRLCCRAARRERRVAPKKPK